MSRDGSIPWRITLLIVIVLSISGCGGTNTKSETFTLEKGENEIFELKSMVDVEWRLEYLNGNSTVDILFLNESMYKEFRKGNNYTWVNQFSAINVTNCSRSNSETQQVRHGTYYAIIMNPLREEIDPGGLVKVHFWVKYWD